jgi:ferrous iron transport protein B
MRIALAGNPNSGKTTMFNALTGKNEKVGNWAGVTVDKKASPIRKSLYDGSETIVVVDLPGAYSMSPFTSEESVTRDYINNEKPDVIVNIVDATNLSRSLFFTTQLLELGIPVVIALNKTDINEKKQTEINVGLLGRMLNCPVVETVSTAADGMREVINSAIEIIGRPQKAPYVQSPIDMADKRSVSQADEKRFQFVNQIVKTVEKRRVLTRERNFQDEIDDILTNKWFGLPIFAIVMFLVFWISQAGPGVWIADWLTGILEGVQEWIAGFFVNANPLVTSLLVDGVIGGAIAVIGFLPLVMVMYFLIALLEDCGYMARASVVLDPIFKRVGLSGKSIIPFVVGTGCAIPGVMACRTIRNERERRATAMLAPFMPCGAKLPVIALFAGAFFEDASWVGPLMYFAGILIIFFGALLVNKITGNKAKKSFFIIELPEYKLPSFKRAFFSMCQRGWSYIVKAATIILLCNTAVQIMQSFTWQLVVAESADQSILASIAGPFAYVLVPVVGVLSWQLAAAAITGFIAKENVVGTLAVCFVGLENLIDTEELTLMNGAGADVSAVMAITKIAALAYLMFNLFTPPCFAAIGAMRSEMRSAKWFWAGIGLQLGTGFTVAYLVYQVGTLITTGEFGAGFVGGLVAVAAFAVILVVLCINGDKKAKKAQAEKVKNRAMVK